MGLYRQGSELAVLRSRVERVGEQGPLQKSAENSDLVGQRTTWYFRTEKLRARRTRNITNMVFRMRVAKHPAGYVPGGNPATGDQLWYWRVHSDTGSYLYGSFEIEDHGWDTPTHLPEDGSFTRSADISYNQSRNKYD